MKLLILAAAGALAAPAALAHPLAQPPDYQGDLAGFHAGPAALPRAIRAVERNGGRVMEIRYDNRDGAPGWDVVVERGGVVSSERFGEPAAGVIAWRSQSEPRWMLDWRARKEARATTRARVDLARAVTIAERANRDAPAVAAGIAQAVGDPTATIPAYNVLLLTSGGGTKRVAVDARNGRIIADPGALHGWP